MPSNRDRAGFTLVETLVALVLLELGVLALVATAGTAARDFAEATALRRAHTMARNRAESMLATACGASGGGSVAAGAGIAEAWRIEATGQSRVVIASASVRLPRGRRAAIEARAWTICPR